MRQPRASAHMARSADAGPREMAAWVWCEHVRAELFKDSVKCAGCGQPMALAGGPGIHYRNAHYHVGCALDLLPAPTLYGFGGG